MADDFGSTFATAGTLALGTLGTGTIEVPGDNDWFKVTLVAGTSYTFYAAGEGTLYDTFLTLRNSSGGLLAQNDDTNSLDSEISFTPTVSGTYILEVRDSGGFLVGPYSVAAVALNDRGLFTPAGEFVSLPTPGLRWNAGDGNDVVIGTAGTDSIYGGNGFDNLYSGAGNDILFGGDNDDILAGGANGDLVYGGNGNDVLSELFDSIGSGNDVLDGGNGIDIIYAENGDDTVYGGAFDSSNNYANLGAGNDRYTGSSGTDVVVGGTGNDIIDGNQGDDSLYGEDGNDTINGGSGIDLLAGGGGIDTLDGGANNDLVVGGDDQDFISGGSGIDVLYGGNGNDFVYGGNDQTVDALYGGAGSDVFRVGGGATLASIDYVWDWGYTEDSIQLAVGTTYLSNYQQSGNTYLLFDTNNNGNPDYTVVLVGLTQNFLPNSQILATTFTP
jgi:Ca2+-binding RTX toxin-like protein